LGLEDMTSSPGRLQKLAPWLAGTIAALPVLLTHYPPMTDLPLHEAVVSMVRHYRDPAFNPGLYEINLGHPNQLFVFVACALSFIFSVTAATKITVALTMIAIAVGASRLAAHMKAPAWSTLLVVPLGMGWLFFWGLIANMVGLATLLFALPTLDRYGVRPTARGFVGCLAVFVGLFLAHESMLLVACVFLMMLAVIYPWSLRETSLRAGPTLILFCAALIEVLVIGRNTMNAHIPTIWGTPWHRLAIIPGLVSAGFEMWVRNTVFVLALGALGLLAASRMRATRSEDRPPWRERLRDNRFELLSLALLVAYFAFPMTLNGATLVYHRFLPPAWAVGVLAITRSVPGAKPLHRLAPAAAVMSFCACLLVAIPVFLDGDKCFRDLDATLAPMDRGQAIMGIELGPTPPNRLFSPTTAEGHAVALKGGRSFFDYTLSNISLAYMKTEYQLPYTSKRLGESNFLFRPEVDLKRFRYVLLHTRDPMRGAAAITAFYPEARLVSRNGERFLFESTLPLLPLTAPDEPLTDDRATTLHIRVLEALKLLRGRNVDELLNGPPVYVP
jgi:hypothetical protein